MLSFCHELYILEELSALILTNSNNLTRNGKLSKHILVVSFRNIGLTWHEKNGIKQKRKKTDYDQKV